MIRPDGSRERGRRAGRRETGDVRDGAQLETRDRAAGRGWERERRDVLAYLKTFSAFFQDTSQHIVPLTFSKEPGGATSAEALRVGRQFYDSIGCWKCHGKAGRGDGPSAQTLKTDPGEPIFAADLHQSGRFRGGASAAEIYRRLRTGLDGTPMPSFS